MPILLGALNVPLTQDPNLGPDSYPYPWIEVIQEEIFHLEERGLDAQEFNADGEEDDGHYIFVITSESEGGLVSAAYHLATLPGVPMGAFLRVTDDESGPFFGGRIVPITQ